MLCNVRCGRVSNKCVWLKLGTVAIVKQFLEKQTSSPASQPCHQRQITKRRLIPINRFIIIIINIIIIIILNRKKKD